MGSVSMAIAKAAQLQGAELHTEKPVQQIIVKNNVVEGVLLQDGTVVRAKTVLSNATPKVTFFDLLSDTTLPDDFKKQLANIDYSSPATKINVALRGLPNFIASPNTPGDPRPGPHHQCLIFLNCESIETIHQAYLDCLQGEASLRPYIEMCMPSSLDPTLAPEGCHVLSLFTQYTPYQPASGPWNDENKEKYCQKGWDSKILRVWHSSIIVRGTTITPREPPVEEVLHSGRHSLELHAHPHGPAVQNFLIVVHNLYPHDDALAGEATVFLLPVVSDPALRFLLA
eukprot:Em0013g242a